MLFVADCDVRLKGARVQVRARNLEEAKAKLAAGNYYLVDWAWGKLEEVEVKSELRKQDE